jgi:hypothetical protein
MLSSILTKVSLFLFCLSLDAHAASTDDFSVYNAQSRSAEELKKAADGLANGARTSVLNNKVVIAGSKTQREGVLKLFSSLDHKLQNFIVSVRAATRGNSSREAYAVEGDAGGPNVGIAKKKRSSLAQEWWKSVRGRRGCIGGKRRSR